MQNLTARRIATGVICLAGLALPSPARAQLTSITGYDYNLLTSTDRAALGEQLLPQMARGAMALVFPDGRKPITDRDEIRRWVTSGKPLRAVAFPGLNADSLATWGLAKEIAVTNAKDDLRSMIRATDSGAAAPKLLTRLERRHASSPTHRAKVTAALQPVLAVNTGWTDVGAVFGHFFEMGGVRNAVQGQRAFKAGPSARVAEMLQQRFARANKDGKKADKVAVVGYSAGGYHAANVAWNLKELGLANLRQVAVQNVGIATQLPTRVRSSQSIGTADFVGKANSDSDALASSSTRVVGGMSHLHGEHWRFGDAMAQRPLEIAPLRAALKRPGDLRPAMGGAGRVSFRDPRKRRDLYRTLAKSLRAAHGKARDAVRAHKRDAAGAVDRVILAKLKHDALALDIQARRLEAAGDLLDARLRGDKPAETRARKRALRLKRRGRAATAALGRIISRTPRDVLSDSTGFMASMSSQTVMNMLPTNIMGSWFALGDAAMRQYRLALDSYWGAFNVGTRMVLGGAQRNSRLGGGAGGPRRKGHFHRRARRAPVGHHGMARLPARRR
jgi:hypothetical protein